MRQTRVSALTGGALLLAVFLLPTVLAVSPNRGEPKAIRQSPLSDEQKAAHLLNRLGYGPAPGSIEQVKALGFAKFIEQQLHPEALEDAALRPRLQRLETIHLSTQRLSQLFPRGGVAKRLVEAGAIDRDELPRGFRKAFARQEQNPGPEGGEQAPERARGARGRQAVDSFEEAGNPIYRPIRYLPEPVERPGRLGSRQPPILGINPQQLVVAQMQSAKLIRAVHSERQLEEIMVDFWMNHFNVFMAKGVERVLVPSYERDVIRPHALGKFRDLLGATAHSPAMLFYLDNFQSVSPESRLGQRRDRGLNENYARELMELHTLGVDGGYVQQDVIEVAKVFTGWTFLGGGRGGNRARGRRGGEMESADQLGFRFLAVAHAPGDKKVLGHTIKAGGVEEGERVLDILAEHPSTARFLAAKLVRRFVADDPPPSLVKEVAATYRKTDGDIRAMLRTVFYSKEFWSADTFQAKTKKPLELVASTIRALGAELTPTPVLLAAMNRLGEPLYLCQPPTGYPDVGEEWLNSGTLLYRWKFALGAAAGKLPGIDYEGWGDIEGRPLPEALDELAKQLLPAQLSAPVRTNIEEKARDQLAQRRDPDAPLADREVRYLAGLLLGSPDFQKR